MMINTSPYELWLRVWANAEHCPEQLPPCPT